MPKSEYFHVTKEVSIENLIDYVSRTKGYPKEILKIIHNGHYIKDQYAVPNNSAVHVSLSLLGGKGGFGSMLRAIGAQIEKTTNREACRDLSGRRLRDINEEQRLKRWIAKKAEREREAAERRRRKLERLRCPPKHDFHDSEYDRERRDMTERIDDALTHGLKTSSKRKPEEELPLPKKKCLWLGVDIGEQEELDSNNEESSEENPSSDSINEMEIKNEDNERNQDDLFSSDSTSAAYEDNAESNESLTNEVDKTELTLTSSNCSSSNSKEVSKDSETLDLMSFNSVEELETLGLDRLKSALLSLNMKCGGTLQQRAHRLWSVRGIDPSQISPSLLAKPQKSKK